MDNSTAPKSTPDTDESMDGSVDPNLEKATPLRCFVGALIAGGFSLLAYRLLLSIAVSFANHPILSKSSTTVNLSVAVRTLVQGVVALGAGVFGVAALGLAALGVQLLIQGKPKSEAS